MEAIWIHRSRASDLVGTVINIHNGDWVRRGINNFHLHMFGSKPSVYMYYSLQLLSIGFCSSLTKVTCKFCFGGSLNLSLNPPQVMLSRAL